MYKTWFWHKIRGHRVYVDRGFGWLVSNPQVICSEPCRRIVWQTIDGRK